MKLLSKTLTSTYKKAFLSVFAVLISISAYISVGVISPAYAQYECYEEEIEIEEGAELPAGYYLSIDECMYSGASCLPSQAGSTSCTPSGKKIRCGNAYLGTELVYHWNVQVGEDCATTTSSGCYTKTNNVCTLRDSDYCQEFESAGGQNIYTSLSACQSAATSCAPSTYYTPSGTGTTGAQCCVGGVTECATGFTCGGTNATFSTCQPTTSGTGGTGTGSTPNQSGSANGSGSCSACLGLGGQAERDCYARCDGTVQTGLCAGMTTSQCQSACAAAGGTPQVCTGTQEAAGTPRAGEFLSCSNTGSVNGCGQFDCLDPNNPDILLGFVIDNSQCAAPATGGQPSNPSTPNTPSSPKPSPTLNPDLAACGEGCVDDNNCADALHSCVEGVCRLTTNDTSPDCTDAVGASPTPVPQPSPTPVPTANPTLAKCDEACTNHADCADLLHSCQAGRCRLTSNIGNDECKTPDNTTPPTVPRTPSTPLQCNDPCTANSQCTSFNHVCSNGTCRLSTNLDNVSCKAAVVYTSSSTQLGQINQQPDSPTALPSAGANDFNTWIMAGIGALGVGAIILLLL